MDYSLGTFGNTNLKSAVNERHVEMEVLVVNQERDVGLRIEKYVIFNSS
jgi:hypothetical protein